MQVSAFCKKTFPSALCSDPNFNSNPPKALANACNTTSNMLKQSGIDGTLAGSTCCAVLVKGDKLFVSNVGDSRAVTGTDDKDSKGGVRPKCMTQDHTAAHPGEKKRILAHGGRIQGPKNRIYCADSDVPGLIPSRSLGDFAGRPAGIISDPDVSQLSIDEKLNFVLVMSDGVWENVPMAKLVEIVKGNRKRPEVVSKMLVNFARDSIKRNHRYRDDMSAIVVTFDNYGKFTPAKSGPTAQERLDQEAPKIENAAERVCEAIAHCEALVDKGVHVDDAPDAIGGLVWEERVQVLEFLHKYRGGSPPPSSPPTGSASSPEKPKRRSSRDGGSRSTSRSTSRRNSRSG